MLDQLADEGCLWLLLTGGEPFIRRDFLDIYTYAKKKGLLVSVFTNGTMITPRIADYLADWRPFNIEITLYGSTQNTYERVTGVSGSFKRCMEGIELLLERNLSLKLKSVIMTLNDHELWDMKAFSEGLGVDFRFDAELNIRLDGGKGPAEFRLSPRDVVELDRADEKRMEGWREFEAMFGGKPPKTDSLYQCGAGIGTFHIDSTGNLSACMMAREPNYDLSQGTVHLAWVDFLPGVLEQKWKSDSPCKLCELNAMCTQCPGMAYIEHGDQETPVDYLCQIAHLRAEALTLA